MEKKCAKGPIFVIGSPRSGTSILTWCLGQHSNILPQEESGWMGHLAVDLGVGYQFGSQFERRSQLSASGVDRDAFFEAFGEAIDSMIHRHRDQLEQKCKQFAEQNPARVDSAFNVSRSNEESKLRWVDGTPEYSFYICGLRKLFPNAKFVHIVRDVESVVNSMLNFRLNGAHGLVEIEQQAYEYWLNAVEACNRAERALGPDVVHQLRYDDLVNNSEQTVRDLLAFLDEPYEVACIEPLARRINSSEVPVGFKARDARTDPRVVERALRLSEQLQKPYESRRQSPAAAAELETDFNKRVEFAAGLDAEYAYAQQKVAVLSNRLNWCGLLLAINALFAVAGALLKDVYGLMYSEFWVIWALASTVIYAVFRRAGLAQLITQMSRRFVPSRAATVYRYAARQSVVGVSRKSSANI